MVSQLLTDLPVEVLLDHVLPVLSLKSLLALGSTNRFFNQICNDDTFWKLKLHEDFNFSPNADTARESGWKIIYKGLRKPSVYTWGATGQSRLGLSRYPSGFSGHSSGVPFPAKVDIDARIISLSPGGWSFNALDHLGNIHVWGQLDGGGYALNSDGFVVATKTAKVPHRLQIHYPNTSTSSPVKFASVSCGRGHSAALDSERKGWIFTNWGRPILLTSHSLTDPHDPITQVESGWGFVAKLTTSGSVYVTWHANVDDPFNKKLEEINQDLDMGPNADSTKGPANNRVISCTSIAIDVDPVPLPAIPDNLPELVYSTPEGTTSFDAMIDASGKVVEAPKDGRNEVKLVRIGAGDNFIVGLTNRGHVLCIDLTGADSAPAQGTEWLKEQWRTRRRTGWVYRPDYCEIEAIGKHPVFAADRDDISKPVPPNKLRITHISAHFNTFVAYSVEGTTAPHKSVVLVGNKVPASSSDSNAPTDWSFGFKRTIHESLLSEPVISLSLGDYHNAALTSTGKLLTWGKYSNGALGLGDPRYIPVGAPGGYNNDRDRAVAQDDRFWDRGEPPEVTVPSEVRFDSTFTAAGEQTLSGGRKYVIGVAASGWHTGALVINLDGHDEPTRVASPEDEALDAHPPGAIRPWQARRGRHGLPGNWPHPQPTDQPEGGDDPMREFETPPIFPEAGSSTGPPYPLPQPPFQTRGPHPPIRAGPVFGRLGYAARGAHIGRGRGVPGPDTLGETYGHRPAPGWNDVPRPGQGGSEGGNQP